MENITGKKLYSYKGVGKILLLVILLAALVMAIRGIFYPNMSIVSIYILPVLLTVIYYAVSKDNLLTKAYEISAKEKAVKRNLFIISLVDALAVQVGLTFVLPWYLDFAGINNIFLSINIYTAVVVMINAVSMLYLVYRYIKYHETGLGSLLSVQFGVFATALFTYYILRNISDPEVIYEFIFVLMPYIISVLLFAGIEMYVKRRANK